MPSTILSVRDLSSGRSAAAFVSTCTSFESSTTARAVHHVVSTHVAACIIREEGTRKGPELTVQRRETKAAAAAAMRMGAVDGRDARPAGRGGGA